MLVYLDLTVLPRDLLSEVTFEQFAFLTFEAAYGLLFYLAHSFACQVEFGTDLFKCHLLTADAEEHLDFMLTMRTGIYIKNC